VPPEGVIDLLGALVRKSLVHADTGQAETRYRLLDSIGHYAADKLRAAGEEAAVRDAHCDWSVALAERAEVGLATGTQAGWLRRLETEQDNFRAACEWATQAARADALLRLGGALVPFWWLQGHVGEGMHLLDRALDTGPEERPQLRAKALWGAAFLIGSAGRVGRALPLAEQSAALAERCGDAATADRARNLVGLLSMYRSPVDALPMLQENLRLARATGDVALLSASLCNLASALLLVGDPTGAGANLDECLDRARQCGNRSLVAEVLGLLGQAALAGGDYPTAESHLGDALAAARDLGERGEEAIVLSWLGELARGSAPTIVQAVLAGDGVPDEAAALRLRRRIAVEHGGARHVALLQANREAVLQIDGGKQDHARLTLLVTHGFHLRKLAISASPSFWLFSGWNCVPAMLSRATIAVIGPP